jgi:hypothetical protein
MNNAQTTHNVIFANGATLTVGTRTYKLSLVSTWATITGKKVTNGHMDMHCTASGHGWGGSVTAEQWNQLK